MIKNKPPYLMILFTELPGFLFAVILAYLLNISYPIDQNLIFLILFLSWNLFLVAASQIVVEMILDFQEIQEEVARHFPIYKEGVNK